MADTSFTWWTPKPPLVRSIVGYVEQGRRHPRGLLDIFHSIGPGLEGLGIKGLGQFYFFRGHDAHHAVRIDYGEPLTFGQARSYRLFTLQLFLGDAQQLCP